MAILNTLESLKKIPGYLGAGVFDPDGKMLGGVTEIGGVSFEIAGSLFHDIFLISNNRSIECGFGKTTSVLINSQMGIVFIQAYRQGTIHFHTIMVTQKDVNVNLAWQSLYQVVLELAQEFK